MSNALTLARPYARAAFELARSEQAAAAWSSRLAFAAQVAGQSVVQTLIGSPKLSAADRVALFLPDGEPADGSFGRFLALLESNQRLALLGEIAGLYEGLRADDERTLKVRVRAAMPIDSVQQQQLAGALAKRFDRTVTLDVVIDAELIGGAVVEAGDVVIDGSLKGKLARLRADLAQ
ncbi:MAG: F0F1 ATP synthase subunit delta [Lysobacterales bacterium]